MNAKRQTIPIILANADYSIYEAYTNSGITDGSDQEIHWYLEVPDATTTDTIVDRLNEILPGRGGFDDFVIGVIPSSGNDWTISIQTFDFTLDYKTIVEFSHMLYAICKKYGAEYRFWTIVR